MIVQTTPPWQPLPFPETAPVDPPADPPAAAGGTTAVDATAPATDPNALSLSPDALMAYCQSRLSSLDSQMSGIFTSQEKNAKVTQDLNQVASAINALPGPDGGTPAKVALSADQINQLQAAYATAVSDAGGPNTELGASLTRDAKTFPPAGSGDTSMSADQVSQESQSLKGYSSDLNSNSELTMISLQSLMSQLQTAVQLTTNLVQSLDQQASDITKNVGG